jgi:hypothetical protein
MNLMPVSESATTVVLQNLHVERGDALVPALLVGCNLEATNVDIIQPGSGALGYETALCMATSTTLTNSTVILTSCALVAHNAVQCGRAARDTFLTSCTLTSVDDIIPFDFCIVNNMNYPPDNYVTGDFTTGPYFLSQIPEPRNITLNRCQLTAGILSGWPADTLTGYYHDQHNCIGTYTAINTLFVSADGGSAFRVGDPTSTDNPNSVNELPDDNPCAIVFEHVTVRKQQPFGDMYIYGDANISITNSLFDNPLSNYAVLKAFQLSPGTLTGEANTYNIPAGYVANSAGGFEQNSNYNVRAANGTLEDSLTTVGGHLNRLNDLSLVVAKAVALTPPITVDYENQARPQPNSASANDIGADEIDELQSKVGDWQIF